MAENDLPENVIPITAIRINHNKDKKCTCRNRCFEVDTQNKEILCAECGAVVPPYDAMLDIAFDVNTMNMEVESLREQRMKLLNWKPHLIALRKLERIYRSGSMLPSCPHCGRGIEAQELLKREVNKQMEMERRKFEAKDGDTQ